jgi:hypothetical protein
MFKVASALLLAAISITPANAATSIILNSGNTALPAYTTAAVFQNFNVPATGVNPFVPNSTIQPGIGVESISETRARTVTTRDAGLAGLTGDYLAIANGASYSLSFLQPQAFFSFAFNIAANPGNSAFVTLNFVNGTSETYFGSAIFGSPSSLPTFGRVSYDVGSGSKISSIKIGKNDGGNTARFSTDNFAAAVPEPATWLMMILGFGLVGSQLRRRKVKLTLSAA